MSQDSSIPSKEPMEMSTLVKKPKTTVDKILKKNIMESITIGDSKYVLKQFTKRWEAWRQFKLIFEVISDTQTTIVEGYSCCIICSSVIFYNNTTTSMLQHMKICKTKKSKLEVTHL